MSEKMEKERMADAAIADEGAVDRMGHPAAGVVAEGGERTLSRLGRRPGKATRGKGKGSVQADVGIFSSDMIIDSIQIMRKDCEAYVKSKAQSMFGSPDFYYGYVYHDGWLVFVAIKSKKHVVGGYSVFCPALIRPGIYYFTEGKRVHYVRNTDKGVVHEVGTKEHMQEDFVNLAGMEMPSKTPETLAFKWSMTKRTVSVGLVVAACFVASLVFWAVTGISGIDFGDGKDYVKIEESFRKKVVEAKQKTDDLPHVPAMIERVGREVGNVGIIQSVTLKENKGKTADFDFVIKFEKERDAQAFINRIGGKYEAGLVRYTASAAGSR